jgi:UDP-hydrolysing UDP-N-acetyl-D-glucosamine 2-epimerase
VRTLGVVTTARADYGIWYPVLRAIQAESELRLCLIVAGMHLAPAYGYTLDAIEADGFPIAEKVDLLLASDTPESVVKSMGVGLLGYAQALARLKPDILMVLGDRFEMFAAAAAALPFKIPVAHIHGGELTQGAIDDALRHAITKLAHFHFVAAEEYARRVIQMGEEHWRVIVSGAPSLDNLHSLRLLDRSQFEERYRVALDPAPLLVTFHPVTLEFEQTEWHITELLAALEEAKLPIIFTLPNADTGNQRVCQRIQEFAKQHPTSRILDNLGTVGYFSLMRWAVAMVGNSSSGLIEAPSFHLPVVNVGTRQQGRVRGSNVIDVDYPRQSIRAGLRQALASSFRAGLLNQPNPYGTGQAAQVIVRRLLRLSSQECLARKAFYDIPITRQPGAANVTAPGCVPG